MTLAKGGMAWSNTALADEYGIDRKTVSRLMENVDPSGNVRGYAVYSIRSASIPIVKYILSGKNMDSVMDEYDNTNPDNMNPKDRKDWYDSELKRIKHAETCGNLIPADVVANADAAKNKKIALMLDTMPDVIARDLGLSEEQLEGMQRLIDNMRNELYRSLIGEDQ